ncbi:MAG: AraC family transcriptional regulator [Polyangiaceae bacterium]|nr:AraC family transcriptional regulator [Polyangiaceae bacterium]
MADRPTVLAAMARELVRYADGRFVEGERLLRAASIDPALLSAGEHARLPHDAYVRLWSEAERLGGGPDLGLRFAEHEAASEALGLVGFLAMASRTMGEALGHVARFHPLLKDESIARTTIDHGLLVIEQSGPPGPIAPRALSDHTLASYLTLGRRWTGEPLAVREAWLRHPGPDSPAQRAAYERVFGGRVRFDCTADALLLDASTLELPLRTAQPALAAYLASQAATALSARSRVGVEGRVRDLVRGELVAGEASLPRVARRLGVSRRTLQRRLEARGLTFEALVDGVRRSEAELLLRTTSLPILDVSEQVGYSDSRAFRRAFQRWTGTSPAKFRAGSPT